MTRSREQWALGVMSGEDRSARAALLRGALRAAEPFYALAMTARNALYDRGIIKSHALPRPAVAVGNITTGGTGKTPVTLLLAQKLIEHQLRPAILLRGYRAEQTGGSDEAKVLQAALGPRAAVVINPDRIAGAAEAMRQSPQPDVFLLDDAFQHRRARRDFNLVLIDATNPFGYGHVLPRGLLREPCRGLRRADAILLTRVSTLDRVDRVQREIRRYNQQAPILLSEHVHTALVSPDGTERSISVLTGTPFYAFAGIGNPQSLRGQLQGWGSTFRGFAAFPDHHAYSLQDMRALDTAARAAGAEMLVTTEKDWVKIARFERGEDGLPLYRLKLEVQLSADSADRLIALILSRLGLSSRASASVAADPIA